MHSCMLLGLPQPTDIGKSGHSISSGVRLVGMAGAVIQRVLIWDAVVRHPVQAQATLVCA